MGLTLGGAKLYLMQVRAHFAVPAPPPPSPSFIQNVMSAPPVLPPMFKAADEFSELLYDTAVHGASNKAFHECCDSRGPTIGVFSSDHEDHVWGWYGPST
jgi:hypothetical protein